MKIKIKNKKKKNSYRLLSGYLLGANWLKRVLGFPKIRSQAATNKSAQVIFKLIALLRY